MCIRDRVYGIEIVPRAIEDAKHNAEINGIENAEFEAGKAEDILPRMYAEGKRADVIFLDPPRKGCEMSVIDAVCGMQPEKVVYVSCDPATLARDMKLFDERGYKAGMVQPVDQFCQTGHVETVVLLSKGEVDSKKIRVEFSLEDWQNNQTNTLRTHVNLYLALSRMIPSYCFLNHSMASSRVTL